MSRFKAIVLDLDGTLLDNKKRVSDANLQAIQKCYSLGFHIILATARPPRWVKEYVPSDLLSLGPIIYYNGALIRNADLSLNQHFPIDEKLSKQILTHILSNINRYNISIESMDSWFSIEHLDYSAFMSVRQNPQVITKEEFLKTPCTKILLTHYTNSHDFINEFKDVVNIVETDTKRLIQVMSKDVSKERAVASILNSLGCNLSDTIVFGDDYNDVDIFRTCGFPIAMGNAVPKLKNLAKYITVDNNNNGVAIGLEHVLDL